MDPNETLKTIRELVDRTNAYGDEVPPFVLDLVHTIEDLDGWLRKGGFHPTDWSRQTGTESKP